VSELVEASNQLNRFDILPCHGRNPDGVVIYSVETPRSRSLPEKLVRKFSAFYAIRTFIASFTGTRHLSLS
jgi:hypothetical protein